MLPNTLGSTLAFPMFREAAAGYFLWFFVRFSLYLKKEKGYREVVASALIGLIKTSMRSAAMLCSSETRFFLF